MKLYGTIWMYFLKFKNKYVLYISTVKAINQTLFYIYIYNINNHLHMTLDNSPNQENIYLDIFM